MSHPVTIDNMHRVFCVYIIYGETFNAHVLRNDAAYQEGGVHLKIMCLVRYAQDPECLVYTQNKVMEEFSN